MPFEKTENGGQHRRLARACAQARRGEAGQRQQPLGTVLVGQRPGERGKRQRGGIMVCVGAGHRLLSGGFAGAATVAKKVLVVEDNELNLKLFCDLLRAHGYETEPVRDGREAVDRAGAFGPDLIIMDIQLPHVSGLELIERIKADAALKAIPIMAVTAYAAKGDEERIRGAGAESYVSKPISVMRFVEAVKALV